MKKTLLLITVLAIAAMCVFKCTNNNKKPKESAKVTIKKIDGNWQNATANVVDPDSLPLPPTSIEALQRERDHFFSRYSHYKAEAYKLSQELASIEAALLDANGCEDLVYALKLKITAMADKGRRDSLLIVELFKEFDNKGEKRQYEGEVNGDNFTTSWRATVYGVLPSDGLLLKTDVMNTTTTIERQIEVFRKNQLEAFAGIDARINPLIGIGYERKMLKWAGIFGQGEYHTKDNNVVAKGGIRIHFQ